MASTINAKNTSTGLVMTPDSSGQLELQTADTTRMTIDVNGNVGIGTSSPVNLLTIQSSTSPNDTYGYVQAYYSGASVNGNAGFTAKNLSGTSQFMQWDVNGLRIGSRIKTGSGTGQVVFTYGNDSEAMRIDSSGNVLVGTTDSSKTAGVGFKVLPAGYATTPVICCVGSASTSASETWNVYSTGAGAYRFYVGYQGTVYATNTTISAISDQRYKENVRDLDVGLDAVIALKPRVFDWKAGKGKDIKNDRGFIAQEFEQVFPDLIDEWKDPAPEGEEPYKSVRQDLIPVLVKAIQELKAELDTVKAELAELKGAA